jgi:thioredoxin 1
MQAAPAALADEAAAMPPASSSIESLDSAIQNIGNAQAETAPPVAPELRPAIAAPNPAPPVASAPAAPVAETAQAQAADTSPILWVYEFSAKWCPSCRKLDPIVEEAAAKYNGFIKFVPINVDKNEALVRKLNVAQIPTVMVVDRSGRTLNRLIGLQQGAQLAEILDHYKTQSVAAAGSGTQ